MSSVKTTTVRSNGSSRSITRMLFSAWYRKTKSKDQAFAPECPVRFSLSQLQVATDNFRKRNYLGVCAFGSVYKGRLADGTLVSIQIHSQWKWKTLEPYTDLQFQTEFEMISLSTVHRNLLRLYGFCTTPTELLLIYPYMANRSVSSYLTERPTNVSRLDWRTRKHIALGSARGLSYLHDHCDPKIIHCNVNAENILLDEMFEAVVGGFILSKLTDHNVTDMASSVRRHTVGHIAPEYLSTGKMTEKTDVFAYGVTLLELITGHTAFVLARLANDDDLMLLDWVKGLLKVKKLERLVDPALKKKYVEEEVEQLIQIALLCTQNSALGRPRMSEVVSLLEGDGLAEKWDEWHKVDEELQKEEELALHLTSDSTDESNS
ncbi:hypothetical protein ACS0TY_025783 [Phlomoides rotata]